VKLVVRIICLVFSIIVVVTAMATGTRAQQRSNPIDLFAKVFPVFSHPRCINCHGVVQSHPGIIRSVTGLTHPGGWVGDPNETVECGTCHNEPTVLERVWEFTAPHSMWWVGKNVEELCILQAAQVRNFNRAAGSASPAARGSYLNHLGTDPLITQAFDGRAGGARDPLPAAPPPMGRSDFLAAAKEWVDAGAPCRANGLITQVETFASHYSYPYPVGTAGKVTVRESAKRDVHITRYPDGTAKGHVTIGGHQTIVIFYRDVGGGGPCEVTMTTTTDWISTNPASVGAEVDVKRLDGGYEISFTVPGDKTQQTSAGRVVSDCGGLPNLNSDDQDDELTWQPWNFTIRCPATFTQNADNAIMCDPRQPRDQSLAAGEMTRKIVDESDAAEPQSWLSVSPAGISRADDASFLPITVTTFWFLNLGK
jgi:hypothetical protein